MILSVRMRMIMIMRVQVIMRMIVRVRAGGLQSRLGFKVQDKVF